MKTPYEKAFEFGFHSLLFGKPKRKARKFYAIITFLYIMIYLLIEGARLL